MSDLIPERLVQELTARGFTDIQYNPTMDFRTCIYRIDGPDHPGMLATPLGRSITVHKVGPLRDLMPEYRKLKKLD